MNAKFIQLQLELTVVSYHEITGGDLQLVVRLEAVGLPGRPASLQVLTKRWTTDGDKYVVQWNERRESIPLPKLEPLLGQLCARKTRPSVTCGATPNTVWDGVTLTVSIDGSEWMLRLVPMDAVRGEDVAWVRDVLRKLAGAAALTPQDGMPLEVGE
jgi:hypothetical protein